MGAALRSRTELIVAGSNGPYSHRCETMEPLLGIACVNAGVAVGIGLDYLFARWEPLLRSGDIVYLPLEEAQYTRTDAAISLVPTCRSVVPGIDRTTLMRRSPLVAGGGVLVWTRRRDEPDRDGRGSSARGSALPLKSSTATISVAHTAVSLANAERLATAIPYHDTPDDIVAGDGTTIRRDFIAWAERHDVRVVRLFSSGPVMSPVPELDTARRSAV